MDVPSIKGSIFEGLVQDARRVAEERGADLDELREALDPKDRDLLDGNVTSLQWVPVRAYAALLDWLTRVEGGADPKRYLRQRGARACDRLLEGIYKAYKVEPGMWGQRTGEIMMGMGKLLYNFTSWSFREAGDGVFEIVCADAEDFPECAIHTAHGFIERYSESAAGEAMAVTSKRRTRDRVTFTVQRRG
jgi:hypothetical protein